MNSIQYVEQALNSGRAVFHTMGDHAGESPEKIVSRKQADIAELGYTYWYARSMQPPNLRKFCAGTDTTYVLFYETKPQSRRSWKGKTIHAGQPTKTDSKRFGYMTHFCEGGRECDRFVEIPELFRRPGRCVTGLVDRGACGLKFDYLDNVLPEIHFNPSEWVSVFKKSSQAGVWCAERQETNLDKRWYIVAIARLCKPYSVWFRGEFLENCLMS